MGSRRSKEDDVNRISISIYVTNFLEIFSAKELFQSCKQYGHVVDSFIPQKRTKEGKRFGFVRFINVFNVDRLVNNLCTIWVGQFKLHANKARFQRATLNKGQGADHKKVANSSRPNSGDSRSSNSYVNAVKNHKSVDHDSPAIVLDEDCALSKDLSSSLMGRIKEFASLTNLKNALMNEGFVDLNVSYLGELSFSVDSVLKIRVRRSLVGGGGKTPPDWGGLRMREELSDDDSLDVGMKELKSENDLLQAFEVPDTVFEK
ncbi:nucleotide-binding alpha-beta plait domain-containing protein [Tanacetum coccineum]